MEKSEEHELKNSPEQNAEGNVVDECEKSLLKNNNNTGETKENESKEENCAVSLLDDKTASNFEAGGEKNKTPLRLPRDCVPDIMWEPGILGGYRAVNQPWSYYLNSLFWMHNETVNTWTHLIAPYFVIALLYVLGKDIDFFNDRSSHGMLQFTVASFFVFACSASAHLLGAKSELWFNAMFALDYVGIAFYFYGQGMMLYYCSGNALFYETFGSFYPVMHATATLTITLSSMVSLQFKQYFILCKILKVGSCVMVCFFTQLTLLVRLYSCFKAGDCFDHPNHFQIYPACIALYNGIVFSAHQPERTFPGKFDIWGHSHQWFHIGCMIAPLAKLYACYLDLLTLPREELEMAKPDVLYIWGSFLIVLAINLFLMFLYYIFYLKRMLIVEKLNVEKLINSKYVATLKRSSTKENQTTV